MRYSPGRIKNGLAKGVVFCIMGVPGVVIGVMGLFALYHMPGKLMPLWAYPFGAMLVGLGMVGFGYLRIREARTLTRERALFMSSQASARPGREGGSNPGSEEESRRR